MLKAIPNGKREKMIPHNESRQEESSKREPSEEVERRRENGGTRERES